MTKHFDKTLQEIADIISELNDELIECLPEKEQAWWTGLSCEFNEWWAAIKFQDLHLFDTENSEQQFFEETNEYEDLKDYIKRVLLEKLSLYSFYKFKE